jgi:hypothetical protein
MVTREPMAAVEVAYLQAIVDEHRQSYFKMFWLLLFISVCVPYPFAYTQETDDSEFVFSLFRYVCITAVLMFVFMTSFFVGYLVKNKNVHKDIKMKLKDIEVCTITQKVFMEINNTYHLYIDCSIRLNIEVNEADFMKVMPGDQINVEYGSFSKEYLGYF